MLPVNLPIPLIWWYRGGSALQTHTKVFPGKVYDNGPLSLSLSEACAWELLSLRCSKYVMTEAMKSTSTHSSHSPTQSISNCFMCTVTTLSCGQWVLGLKNYLLNKKSLKVAHHESMQLFITSSGFSIKDRTTTPLLSSILLK